MGCAAAVHLSNSLYIINRWPQYIQRCQPLHIRSSYYTFWESHYTFFLHFWPILQLNYTSWESHYTFFHPSWPILQFTTHFGNGDYTKLGWGVGTSAVLDELREPPLWVKLEKTGLGVPQHNQIWHWKNKYVCLAHAWNMFNMGKN